ncbi:MAG: (Fe-S)-binding protein [Clostridia bacterium BRH_c25]|nr:MAG: (Fe-S)-binding protein [Clostridia bacterium BRH_c25]
MRKRKVQDPLVAIVDAASSQNCVEDVLNMIEASSLIKQGATVVITANMVDSKPASTGTVVHPDLLRKIIRYVKNSKPSRVVVAAGSGGAPTQQVFEEVGFNKIIREEEIEFVDLNYGPYTEISINHDIVPSTKINRLCEEMDVHISFTPIKMHKEATVSLGIKNMALSWPPAEIHGMPKKKLGIHEDLHNFIAAMGEVVPIDITILSGMNGMVWTGPSDGKAVSSNILVAGTDPVAADAVAARMMGLLPQAVHYLFELHRRGLGQADVTKIKIKGLSLIQAEELFSMAALNESIAIDRPRVLTLHGD